METVGSGNLQSGFVLAIVLAAFLFAERLGGTDQLVKRVFQVGLGVVLAFAVIGGTTAFVRSPKLPSALEQGSSFSSSDGSSSSSDNSQVAQDYFRKVANRDSAKHTIHVGVGVLLLVAGIAALGRWPVTAPGGALGGLLLVLFGGVRTATTGADQTGLNALFSIYSSLFGSVLGSPARMVDVAHFIVLLGAAAFLVTFGLMRWDMPPRSKGTQPPAPAEA